MIAFQPVNCRTGVTARDPTRNDSAVRPVTFWMVSTGSVPRSPASAPRTSHRNGSVEPIQSTGRTTRVTQRNAAMLEILAEVHAGVQRRDLIAVTVEHQRRLLEEL